MGNRIYIFDTSYLIDYPDAVNNLTGNMVVPSIVLKQLDGLKNSDKEYVAKNTRMVSYYIREAQRKNRLKIVSEYSKVDMLDSHADNVIVGTAAKIKENNPEAEITLLTTDNNMKIAAEGMGVIIGETTKVPASGSFKVLGQFLTIVGIGVGSSLIFGPGIGFIICFITFFTWIIFNIYKHWRLGNTTGIEPPDYTRPHGPGHPTDFTYKGFDYNRATDRIAAGFDK